MYWNYSYEPVMYPDESEYEADELVRRLVAHDEYHYRRFPND